MKTSPPYAAANKASQNFLLACLHPKSPAPKIRFHMDSPELDWPWLLSYARKHKVLGIFANQLQTYELLEKIPQEVHAQLTQFEESSKQKLAQARTDLKGIHQAFSQAKIPFLIFKGIIFSEELYPKPEVRPFFDLDLLVAEDQVEAASDVLTTLGYQFYAPPFDEMGFVPLGKFPKQNGTLNYDEATTKHLYRKYHYHYPFVVPKTDPRLAIDLHWHFLSRTHRGQSITSQSIWENVREIKLNEETYQTFSPELALLYLATKVAMKGPESFKLLPLCDLMRLMESLEFSVEFSPQTLWDMAAEWKVKRHLRFAFKLIEQLFDFNTNYFRDHEHKGISWLETCSSAALCGTILTDSKSNLDVFKKNVSSVLWDAGLLQPPSRMLKRSVRRSQTYLKKRLMNYANAR